MEDKTMAKFSISPQFLIGRDRERKIMKRIFVALLISTLLTCFIAWAQRRIYLQQAEILGSIGSLAVRMDSVERVSNMCTKTQLPK